MWAAARAFALVHGGGSGLYQVVDYLYDDGYYYLAIAANFADLGRSTYDGITLTNGYQPAWQLILAGLAECVGTEPWRLFVAANVLIWTIALASISYCAFAWSKHKNVVAPCLGVGLALVSLREVLTFYSGMEPILFIGCAIPLVVILERATMQRDFILLSTVLAVAFLIRLDALAIYVAVVGVMTVDALRKGVAAKPLVTMWLQLSVVVLPVVALYCVVNWWVFGVPVPVSGLAKSIGGPRFSNWGVAMQWVTAGRWYLRILVVLVPMELYAYYRAQRDTVFLRSFCAFVVAVLLQMFYYGAFSTWYVWGWYFYASCLAAAVMVARIVYLAARSYEAGARVVPIGAGCIVMAFIALSVAHAVRPPRDAGNAAPPKSVNQESLDMLKAFPAEKGKVLIAMGDVAGGLSYWGRNRLSIVQLEGLTLDMDYIRARIAQRTDEYLKSRFDFQYFAVDREVIPKLDLGDGQIQYVIAEPISGRVTRDPVPIFCFPESAVRYRETYQTSGPVQTRMAFAYSARQPCAPQGVQLIRTAETGIGLRQFSFPSIYEEGWSNKRLEDRDRRRWLNASGR